MELEALANDLSDVTDPSSIDKVLVYFEELVQEAEEYIELLHKKLQYRAITWEQPWYQQGDCPLTKQHAPFYQINETAEEKFRTDKFTREEHERMNKNWNRFTKKYNVPDKLRIFASWKNNNLGNKKRSSPQEQVRHFVVAYLARGLQRTLHQVFGYIKYFNMSLDIARRHVYNEYEEKIMEVCFMHKMDKAPPILAIVLGRHVRGLYKRQAVGKSGKPEKKRVKWSMERAEIFLKGMLKYSELPLDELKNRTFNKSFWLNLQKDMDCDYTYLNFFWYAYLHVQLFVKSDVKLYRFRRKLFKLLRDSPYTAWSDVKWNEILKNFPEGVTRRFLYKMCISIVRKYPKYLKASLTDLANFGLETIQSSRYANKRLKRLMLNAEGNLEVIKYNPDV